MTPNSNAWFVVKVKPMHEQNVEIILRQVGYETCLPLFTRSFRMRGLKKVIRLPLFFCYVFCRSTENAKTRIISIPGVIGLIEFNGGKGTIPDEQIMWIRKATEKGNCVPYLDELPIGKQVVVQQGVFAGVKGTVVKRVTNKPRRLSVAIEMLNRRIAVEIEEDDLRLIKDPAH